MGDIITAIVAIYVIKPIFKFVEMDVKCNHRINDYAELAETLNEHTEEKGYYMNTKETNAVTTVLGIFYAFLILAIITSMLATAFYMGCFDMFGMFKELREFLVTNHLYTFSTITMLINIFTSIPLAITVICMYYNKIELLRTIKKAIEKKEVISEKSAKEFTNL